MSNPDYVVCPICNEKFVYLGGHVKKVHGVSIQDLKLDNPNLKTCAKSYSNRIAKRTLGDDSGEAPRKYPKYDKRPTRYTRVLEPNYVTCPICGVSRSNLGRHIHSYHKMTKEQFQKEYPDSPLVSQSCRENLRAASLQDEGRKTRSENLTRTLNELWKDSEYQEKRRKAGRRQMLKNLENPDYGKAKKAIYNGIAYRSTLEASFAELFDKLQIKHLYEKIRLPYVGDDGKTHIYVLDFYLPERKTVIEVKPEKMLDTIHDGKIEAAQKSPYFYTILTENDLSEKLILERLDGLLAT